VVHALAARLRSEVDATSLEHASNAAAKLAAAPHVTALAVGRSDQHLVVAVWLPDPAALEPFAASPAHMSFVMRGLAPLIDGMWSVSVATDRPPPAPGARAIAVFALPEAEAIFEWQVQRQLDAIDALPGDTWTGPTVEERERYRAGGVVLLDQAAADTFEAALAEATDQALRLDLACAPLLDGGIEP
jgi:hypothetical protein